MYHGQRIDWPTSVELDTSRVRQLVWLVGSLVVLNIGVLAVILSIVWSHCR